MTVLTRAHSVDTIWKMHAIQMASDIPTIELDSPRAAVVATRLAQLMGVFDRPEKAAIDRGLVGSAMRAAARVGVAEAIAAGAGDQPSDQKILGFLDALRRSPRPMSEIVSLAAIFGYSGLERLVAASEPSLRRYAAGDRATPDAVAQRVHLLAQLVAVLRGSFNEFGIRRWFERPHPALGSRAPADVLGRDFDPADARVQAVMNAAAQALW